MLSDGEGGAPEYSVRLEPRVWEAGSIRSKR